MYKICQAEKSLARQRELENGLLSYMETVPFYEMDIAGLCRYLEIPRKTFYRYFGTKEDALSALIDHRLSDMDQYIIHDCGHASSIRQAAYAFFTFWKQEQHFLDVLKQNYLLGKIFSQISSPDIANSRNLIYGSPNFGTFNLYVHNYHMSGIMSLVMQWYADGFQESISEMADLVESIYTTPLQAQIQYQI